jgi:TonB-linked SusC/RagA family outer membrane protein
MKITFSKIPVLTLLGLALFVSDRAQAQSTDGDTVNVGEVTITATGLTTSTRKTGYGVSQIKSKSIVSSGESGIIQAMTGKASNVQITRSTGDPGAGAYIQIRGQNTVTGSNQPLIVVDGVPVSNSSLGGGVEGVVQQSRLNDINPADIENIEILKGAAAAAIWGTRAANGVIMITTKKGKKGLSIEFNSQLAMDEVNREFEKQDKFGQGSAGKWAANVANSWGDKIADRSGTDELNTTGAYFEAADGTKIYPITKKGDKTVYNQTNRDQVFRTGTTWNNNLSISSANDKGSIFFSVSDWDQKGVLNGNSDYRRTSGRLNFSYNANEKLTLSLKSTLAKIFSNRIQQGSNLNGLYLGYLRTPPDFDNRIFEGTYYNAAGVASFGAHRGYRRYMGDAVPTYNNPGWTLNNQINTSDVVRFIVTPEAQYKWNKNANFIARVGYDQSTDRRITYFPVRSSGSNATGTFGDAMISESELSLHLINQSTHKINENITLDATLGYLATDRNFYQIGGSALNFIIQDQDRFAFNNSTSENMTPFNSVSRILNNRVYGTFDFAMKDKLFLQLAAASERASTFADRFLSPSASLSYEFSKDVKVPGMSYGKLRASWGQVGIAPPAYIWGTNYVSAGSTSGWGEIMDASYYGGSIYRSTARGNPNIRPEMKRETEFGADLKFLDNRLTVGATYYMNNTKDIILAVAVPASTGYTNQWSNAAEMKNSGYELDLSYAAIKNDNLQWNIYGNIGTNKNEVVSLAGSKSIFLEGFTGVSSRAVEGQQMGALWGGKWLRDENDKLVLDANGFPQQAPEEGLLGDPNPTWRGAIGTNLTFKGLTLNVLFEACQGNQMWGGTYGIMNNFGVSMETANEVTISADKAAQIKNARGQTVDQFATANTDGSYTVRGNLKDFGAGEVLLDQYWYTGLGGGFGPVGEQFIYDASWVRLRELSLSYQLPESLCKALHIPGASLGFTGRNLALWTNSPQLGVDPETNLTGVTNGRGLDYFNNPGTKSYIFSLSVKI